MGRGEGRGGRGLGVWLGVWGGGVCFEEVGERRVGEGADGIVLARLDA